VKAVNSHLLSLAFCALKYSWHKQTIPR
jgi:hypothetical protein